jgi:hypothetical protein
VIPLSRAYLCADCETVGDNARECVRCKSGAVYPLIKLLNREAATEVEKCVERILKGSVR